MSGRGAVQAGDEVAVIVTEFDRKRRRLALSTTQLIRLSVTPPRSRDLLAVIVGPRAASWALGSAPRGS